MHYRTLHYRTKIQFIESQEEKKHKNLKTNQCPKNDLEWLAGQFSIVGLALDELPFGYVEDYPVRIQHLTNKKRAIGLGWSHSRHKPQQTTYVLISFTTSKCETSGQN